MSYVGEGSGHTLLIWHMGNLHADACAVLEGFSQARQLLPRSVATPCRLQAHGRCCSDVQLATRHQVAPPRLDGGGGALRRGQLTAGGHAARHALDDQRSAYLLCNIKIALRL